MSFLSLFRNIKNNDSGATAIEYGLIAALVAVGLVGALTALGGDLSALFEGVGGNFPAAPE